MFVDILSHISQKIPIIKLNITNHDADNMSDETNLNARGKKIIPQTNV